MKSRYLSTGDEKDSLFDIGDRVEHPVMGLGTILERNANKSAYLIQFDDMPTPRAISYRAKLKATHLGEGEGEREAEVAEEPETGATPATDAAAAPENDAPPADEAPDAGPVPYERKY